MTISLSEQLESDIKEYLHKTFGTYFSSLDERFAADIKEDVINASDFYHGYYNDDDISIAFQRVTLGRMGHPDWQIYHLCTDTEANTMKQNVKVNTPIHIRPASHEEAGLFYSQMKETEDAALGTVGHVRMDFGSSGKGFYHTWWPHNDDQFNTKEFKGELQEVVDALRADGPLKDLASMRSYCQDTIFGGFAPNSQTAEVLSKALGSRTVLSGSVSRGKNDPSQSLQMMERALLTPDELKSIPKGSFIVMKTGTHPMRT